MTEDLKRICKSNGLPIITSHGLRHLCATILLEAGYELEFILTRDHGYPMHRGQHEKLNHVLETAGFDPSEYTWHDIRHSYATILKYNKMNFKLVSKLMGHGSEEFTDKHYVDHHKNVTIYDVSVIMNQFYSKLINIHPVYDISKMDYSFL